MAAASAGQRTALNLAGIEHHEVCRGMVLAAPGRFETTSRLDVRIQLLGSAKKLKNRARVHFHHGSAECIAEVHLLGTREIPAGGKALAQLRLTDPMLALPGDRFVLRQFSPVVTIGGGVVLHISQGRRLHAAQTASFLEVQERALDGDFAARAEAIGQIVQQTPSGCSPAELVKRTGWAEVELATMLEHLAAERKVRIVSQQPLVAVSAMTVATATERLCKEVETFHAANPLLPGTSKEDLRTRCAPGLRTEIFRAALEDAVSAGKLSVVGDLVSRASRAIDLLPSEARAKEQIERDFARAGLSSPGVDTIFATLPVQPAQAQKLFQLLVRERVLLKIGNDIVLHRDAVAALRQRLAEYKQARGDRLAVSDFKELTGVSRKFAIPLLEYLDRTGVTRRVGDYRVIL